MIKRPLLLAAVLFVALPAFAQHAYSLSGDYQGTHDPSIIKQGGTWYVFATGSTPQHGQFAIRCSKDLETGNIAGRSSPPFPTGSSRRAPAPRISGRPTSPTSTASTTSTMRSPSSEKTPRELLCSPTRRSTLPAPPFIGTMKA